MERSWGLVPHCWEATGDGSAAVKVEMWRLKVPWKESEPHVTGAEPPEESPREAVHEPRGQLQQKSSAVWRCQSQPESRRQSVWLMLLMDRAREVCVPKPFEHRRFWVNPRPLTPSFTLLEKEYVQPWEGMWATMRVSLHYCERGCVLPWEGVCAAVGGKCTTMRGSLCYPESELAAFLIISFRFLREVPLHLYSFYQYRE